MLRSNYNLPEVVLKAQVFHKGDFIGSADIALLNGEGGVVQNGKQFLHIKLDNMEDEPTSCRLVVQILDIPTALVAHAEYVCKTMKGLKSTKYCVFRFQLLA